MNRLTEDIAAACREHLLAEKWVVAPSLRAGQQWLDAVARGGQAAVNARPMTLRSMALHLAGPAMAKEGLHLVTGRLGTLIVDSLWRERTDTAGGYLGNLEPTFALSQAIHRTVQDIRLAGLGPDDLAAGAFEHPFKHRELSGMLAAYVRALEERKLIDYADALRMAAARLSKGGLPHEGILVLLPEPDKTDYAALELALVNAVPRDGLVGLAVDRPCTEPAAREQATDAFALRWLPSPEQAPAPLGDGTGQVFRAVGAVNEVREVIRRCLREGIPLDDVEVLHADTATYAPLFHEVMQGLRTEGEDGLAEAPVTFADGLPASYSRPGRLLSAWLAWARDRYPQTALQRMVQGGLLEAPKSEEGRFGLTELADLLRGVRIWQGRDRYLLAIDAEIEAAERRLRETVPTDEEGEPGPGRGLKRRLAALRVLREVTQGMVGLSTERDDVLGSARRLLEDAARCSGQFDEYARRGLLREIRQMSDLLAGLEGDVGIDLLDWLQSLPDECRVGGSSPRPGCLHVAHLLTGGHSGRAHTFIVGLDDTRFPGLPGQDPLLLDGERGRLSADLPTAAASVDRLEGCFGRLLAGLRGSVTLSFPCFDLADDRELAPSPVLVSVYRVLSGNAEGTQTDLLNWEGLPAPASFAPGVEAGCLDESEWWMWRLCGKPAPLDLRAEVAGHFGHLRRGLGACAARASVEFTAWDGNVPVAGPDLDPTADGGPVMSASRLETLGRCPLAFFFQYGLGIEPPEEFEVDPDQWLDARQSGSLLHEVFRRFMAGLLAKGLLPEGERDWSRLAGVLEAVESEYAGLYPPPSRDLFDAAHEDYLQACRNFLSEEESFCRTSRPMWLEASLGMHSDGPGTDLDTDEPLPVQLPGGGTIRARGRLDRIDRVEGAADTYAVWDYKTGSDYRYRDVGKDPFGEGRIVQPALYLAMAERRLKETIGPATKVSHFGYFLPGVKGTGKHIEMTAETLRPGLDVIGELCAVAASGAFCATNDHKQDCHYCDCKAICRDVKAVAQRAAAKLENEGNVALAIFRELRGIEQ